jgi:hypothetical protein
MFLCQQSILLLLLPPLVKAQLLVTGGLNEIERGRIGRINHQPLRVMLEIGQQPLHVMLKNNTQPLQVMLGASTHPRQVMLGEKVQSLLVILAIGL